MPFPGMRAVDSALLEEIRAVFPSVRDYQALLVDDVEKAIRAGIHDVPRDLRARLASAITQPFLEEPQ